MKKHSLHLLAALLCLSSCATKELQPEFSQPADSPFELIPMGDVTISLDSASTKTQFSFSDGILKEVWKSGDVVALTPYACMGGYAVFLYANEGGSRTTTFINPDASYYLVEYSGMYFPGDQITTDYQFCNFSYKGQVQSASDPLAHLSRYRALRQRLDISGDNLIGSSMSLSFAGCEQSSCMRLVLSGAEFDHPVRVTMQSNKDEFLNGNWLDEPESDGSEDYSSDWDLENSISIALEGYGKVDRIEAYIMISNFPVTFTDDDIKVTVQLADGNLLENVQHITKAELPGGYCHTYTVAGDWNLVDMGKMREFIHCKTPGIYDLTDSSNPLNVSMPHSSDSYSFSSRNSGWTFRLLDLAGRNAITMESSNKSLSNGSLHMMKLSTMDGSGVADNGFTNARVVYTDMAEGLVWLLASDEKTGYIVMNE